MTSENRNHPLELVKSSNIDFLKSINSPYFTEKAKRSSLSNTTHCEGLYGLRDTGVSLQDDSVLSGSSTHTENYTRNTFAPHIHTPKNALTKLTDHIASMVWKKLESPRFGKYEFDEMVSNDGFVESLFIEWDNVEHDEDIESVLSMTGKNFSELEKSKLQDSVANSTLTSTLFHDETSIHESVADLHFRDVDNQPKLTAQYILVLSSLNFCFWPSVCPVNQEGSLNYSTTGTQTHIFKQELDYPDLARGLKRIAESSPHLLSSANLSRVTEQDLISWFGSSNIPLLSERVRLLNEVGTVLERYFDGEASVLIEMARKSAANLVSLITSYFPGFRDHAISPVDGRQVFYYKRAQIFVADIWGAFSGKGLGEFYDMNQITMFADYQVPQVLRYLNIMVYDDHLTQLVDNYHVIPAGSPEEMEIRSYTICIVEEIKQILETKHRIRCKSVEIDWYLWQQGERLKRYTNIQPHHRTFTIYY